MRRLLLILFAAFISASMSCVSAYAGVIITISDNGSDLTFDYSGSLDTSTLGAPTAFGGYGGQFIPQIGLVSGRIIANTWEYDSAIVAGPSFGLGFGDVMPVVPFAPALPNAHSGNTGLSFSPGTGLVVAEGYVSGSPITGSMTFGGHTIASQGITPGPHVYTIAGSESTITLQTAPVPEPSSLAIFGLGALGLVAGGIRRRKQKQTA